MNSDGLWKKGLTAAVMAIAMLCAASAARADAIITLTGPSSNAGTINLSSADDNYGGLVTAGGVTGYSLWSLLGTVTTSTPPGDNSKMRSCAIMCLRPVPTAINR